MTIKLYLSVFSKYFFHLGNKYTWIMWLYKNNNPFLKSPVNHVVSNYKVFSSLLYRSCLRDLVLEI